MLGLTVVLRKDGVEPHSLSPWLCPLVAVSALAECMRREMRRVGNDRYRTRFFVKLTPTSTFPLLSLGSTAASWADHKGYVAVTANQRLEAPIDARGRGARLGSSPPAALGWAATRPAPPVKESHGIATKRRHPNRTTSCPRLPSCAAFVQGVNGASSTIRAGVA